MESVSLLSKTAKAHIAPILLSTILRSLTFACIAIRFRSCQHQPFEETCYVFGVLSSRSMYAFFRVNKEAWNRAVCVGIKLPSCVRLRMV